MAHKRRLSTETGRKTRYDVLTYVKLRSEGKIKNVLRVRIIPMSKSGTGRTMYEVTFREPRDFLDFEIV